MSLKNKSKIYYVTAIIVIVVFCLFVWYLRVSAPASDSSTVKNSEVLNNFRIVQVGSTVIRAELATTQAEQVQGLSGRISLATSTGMFFVFDHPASWNIWMKDMNFPIDVLWITDDFKISDIVENMTPASYPKVYTPHVPARYVLELPAGTVKNNEIMVGQSVVLR